MNYYNENGNMVKSKSNQNAFVNFCYEGKQKKLIINAHASLDLIKQELCKRFTSLMHPKMIQLSEHNMFNAIINDGNFGVIKTVLLTTKEYAENALFQVNQQINDQQIDYQQMNDQDLINYDDVNHDEIHDNHMDMELPPIQQPVHGIAKPIAVQFADLKLSMVCSQILHSFCV